MDVNREDLERAFAMAHKAAESPLFPIEARHIFRAIAYTLWKAAGVGHEITGIKKQGGCECQDVSTF